MNIKVMKFSKTSCQPCRVLSQNLEGIQDIENIDLDKNREIAHKYNVRKIPLLIFFKNDKEVHRQTGVITKKEYISLIQEINDSKEI